MNSNEPIVGSKRAHSPRPPPAKRAKASQACLSCRKHKTRCEMLDGDNSGTQCHRCKVLSLSCSFEDGSGPSLAPPSARGLQSEIPSQPNIDRRPFVQLPKKQHDALVDDTSRPSKVWTDTPSDPSPPFRTQPSDAEEADLLHMERLLPEKHSLWSFTKLYGFEGTMVPMLAIQALTHGATNTSESSRTRVDQTLLHLLSREQIKHLIDIFEERYSPWLNLQPSGGSDGNLLRLAQCCVASRHLEPSIRSIVTPQLYRLADEAIFKQSFNPLPSTDAIHAILILSVWEPVGDTAPREPRDARLIAATAVSMAMNLRISEASVHVQTLRHEKKPNEPPSAELIEALDKARLWFALNAVETILCAGTGREPISDCQSLTHEVLDTTSHVTLSATRDLRLSLVCQLFSITQQGLSIRLRSVDELGAFYKEVLDLFVHFDILERLINPLPVVAEHEIFYFRVLHIYYQSCRLLVLLHALTELKVTFAKADDSNNWVLLAEHNGVNLSQSWGQQALVISEAILIATISLPEPALLTTAPDNLFGIVTLAAIFVMLSKWSVLEHAGQPMTGSSDSILARTIERLSFVACSHDHFAARCARLIETGAISFKKRFEKSVMELKEYPKPLVQHFMPSPRTQKGAAEVSSLGASRSASVSSGMGTGAYTSGSPDAPGHSTGGGFAPGPMDPQHAFSHFGMNDSNYFMGTDIFFDHEFWSSFMFNPTDGGGMNMMNG